MSARVTLTKAQGAEVELGRFVRVKLPESPASVLVGRVDGVWRAYQNVCRHRALPLDLGARSPMSDDGEFLLCHQHGALYRRRDGLCVVGPCAGERLAPVDIVAEGEELVLEA